MEQETRLGQNYISVERQGQPSYGGSQTWMDSKRLRGYGCGLIAAADVLLYLGAEERIRLLQGMDGKSARGRKEYSADLYHKFVQWFDRYFPIIPKLGMSGFLLAFGFWRCFRILHLPYKVRWGVFPKKLKAAVEEMLRADIPVVLSIGPNFPKLWGKEGVMLYTKNEEGIYWPSQKTKAHYVTVTGINADYLQISSWGRCYYIRWDEYEKYRFRKSLPLFTNICYITKKNSSKT